VRARSRLACARLAVRRLGSARGALCGALPLPGFKWATPRCDAARARRPRSQMGVTGACMRIDVAEYDAAWTRVGGNAFKMDDSFFNPHDFGMTPNHYVFFQARRSRPRESARASARSVLCWCRRLPAASERASRARRPLQSRASRMRPHLMRKPAGVVPDLQQALACAQRAAAAPEAAWQSGCMQTAAAPARASASRYASLGAGLTGRSARA
jgi:hypothetical protein